MSIKVTCPNGHEMQVKNEFAGKSGLCPHCKSRIEVPVPEPKAVSEDDLLKVLGLPRVVPRTPAFNEPQPSQHPEPVPRFEPGARLPEPRSAEPKKPEQDKPESKKEVAANGGPAHLRRQKVCPRCCEIVSVSHARCPRCQTPLSQWTFPMPDEKTAKERGRSSCHHLGLRKQGDVIVIRFGEHRILDELTVKKLADELFYVAERPDCHNVLLNFFGVVGLSSAMLGIMLMLRKKIAQKPGKLKLCQVGPEIMDIFHATKLGQLFEILDSEQQGLKAFA
jgi:anti-sigma B factor antagonist